MAPVRALVVHREYLEKILNGTKSIEVRGTSTTKRGVIALACNKELYGEVEIVDCKKLAIRASRRDYLQPWGEEEDFILGLRCSMRTGLGFEEVISMKYLKFYGWCLANPTQYEVPKSYYHPRGAMSWIDLTKGPGCFPRPKPPPRPQAEAVYKRIYPKSKSRPLNLKRPAQRGGSRS